MGQQFADSTIGLSRQARQDVLEIKERIVAVEFGRLDQAHDGGRALAGPQAPGKEPVLPPGGNRANAVLDSVVVDRHLTIGEIMDERGPASQAVIDGFCRRRTIGHLLPSPFEPDFEFIEDRFGLFLT